MWKLLNQEYQLHVVGVGVRVGAAVTTEAQRQGQARELT